MPEFIPFRGLRYNEAIVGDLANVLTPPYDVISPAQQDAFYAAHPNNIIRLVLNRAEPGDTDEDSRPARAAGILDSWRQQGILQQDTKPAYYLTAVDFTIDGRPLSRFGIIGRIRVEPFEKGTILPHERTFSKVRSEQMKLLRASRGNFCPIFSIFSDADGVIQNIARSIAVNPPETSLRDAQGVTHRMWRITDETIQNAITGAFQKTTIYIADGHHRYETALAYQREMAATLPKMDRRHPANFVMMYLSSLEDPGLVILPAHRLLKDLPPQAKATFIDKADAYFHIDRYPVRPGTEDAARANFIACIEHHKMLHAFGVCIAGDPTMYCLRLKTGVMERLFGDELAPVLLDLDVTVVTRLALMELLGYDQDRLDDVTRIDYSSTVLGALKAWTQGACDMVVILNPTRIDQVQAVSGQGLIMPRKSTYFYPKTISGQVIYHHDPSPQTTPPTSAF